MELKEGQLWTYKARQHEVSSELIIIKIDDENIHHVALRGLKIKNDQAPNGFSSDVSHFPFDEQALKDSLVSLVASDFEFEEGYLEGYESWLEDYTYGDAGYFTTSVAEAIEYIEIALNQ
jgi:hypothetical protein